MKQKYSISCCSLCTSISPLPPSILFLMAKKAVPLLLFVSPPTSPHLGLRPRFLFIPSSIPSRISLKACKCCLVCIAQHRRSYRKQPVIRS